MLRPAARSDHKGGIAGDAAQRGIDELRLGKAMHLGHLLSHAEGFIQSHTVEAQRKLKALPELDGG
jgi:hypothetical protein